MGDWNAAARNGLDRGMHAWMSEARQCVTVTKLARLLGGWHCWLSDVDLASIASCEAFVTCTPILSGQITCAGSCDREHASSPNTAEQTSPATLLLARLRHSSSSEHLPDHLQMHCDNYSELSELECNMPPAGVLPVCV